MQCQSLIHDCARLVCGSTIQLLCSRLCSYLVRFSFIRFSDFDIWLGGFSGHYFVMKAEEQNNMLFVVHGNPLKQKSDEKAGLLVNLKKRFLELGEKKKTFR